jgi:hypothetical protein
MATAQKGRSVERLQAENEFLRLGGIAEQIGRTVRVLLVSVAVVVIVYFVTHALEALAGKSTDANIFVSLLANMEISVALAWGVGVAGVAYGRHQRGLRKTTIARLQGRIHDLETNIDPNRTSSRLTPQGDTNPEDA